MVNNQKRLLTPVENQVVLESQELESRFIGSILTNNADYWKVADVKAGDFAFDVHAEIFQAAVNLILQGKEASPVTLLPLFKDHDGLKAAGGGAYLFKMTEGYTDARTLADILLDFSSKRKLYRATQSVIDRLVSDPAAKIDDVLSELREVMLLAEDVKIEKYSDVTKRIVQEMQEPVRFNPTGIAALDACLGGGLHPRRSYCIAARYKQGKTVMLHSIALNLALADVKTLFVACEMGTDQIHQRNIARMVGRNSVAFITNHNDPDFISKVVGYQANEKNSFYLNAPGITFDKLRASVTVAAKRHGIKGFFLDYLGLVEGKEKGESEAAFLERVSKWIAQVCKQEGIWCVYASQLNREGMLRGSDGAALSADQVYNLNFNPEDKTAWLEQKATRYTMQQDCGAENHPALVMDMHGPHYRDINR